MKNLNLTLLALLTLGLTFTSCKKDDSPEPTTQQQIEAKKEDPKPELKPVELLVDKKWQVTAMVFDEPIDLGDGEYLTDLFEYMEECEKDDYTIYHTDGTGAEYSGDLKCDENEESSSFLWYINPENENELWIDADGETTILSIVEVKEDLVILETDAFINGETMPIKVHFKAV